MVHAAARAWITYALGARRGDIVSREKIYELVWSAPMINDQSGRELQVSDSYMAGVCSNLRVPRPERRESGSPRPRLPQNRRTAMPPGRRQFSSQTQRDLSLTLTSALETALCWPQRSRR